MPTKRQALLATLLLLPLLAGCLVKHDPLTPELKGRWAAPNAAKLRVALAADRLSNAALAAAPEEASCLDQYVTFEKRGIMLYMDRKVHPLFAVSNVRRDGARLILTGNAPVPGGSEAKIELLLRHGEVRFDDIIDQRGRSIRYERFDNEQAQRVGVKTIGDIFRLVLDVKPCRA
jgi:hypothetical protein